MKKKLNLPKSKTLDKPQTKYGARDLRITGKNEILLVVKLNEQLCDFWFDSEDDAKNLAEVFKAKGYETIYGKFQATEQKKE